jgi:hypothetical protein
MVAYKGFKSYQRAFLGFSISMTLSNQLGIADSLSKPLPAARRVWPNGGYDRCCLTHLCQRKLGILSVLLSQARRRISMVRIT